MLGIVVDYYYSNAFREVVVLVAKHIPVLSAHAQAVHLRVSLELEVESLLKNYVESSNNSSWTELESVSDDFVDFVSDVIHSLLDKIKF